VPSAGTPEGPAAPPGEASFFFYDAHFRNEAVKVLPGEYLRARRGHRSS
jgi:hypothetical protein